jgi:hypothetical protein
VYLQVQQHTAAISKAIFVVILDGDAAVAKLACDKTALENKG